MTIPRESNVAINIPNNNFIFKCPFLPTGYPVHSLYKLSVALKLLNRKKRRIGKEVDILKKVYLILGAFFYVFLTACGSPSNSQEKKNNALEVKDDIPAERADLSGKMKIEEGEDTATFTLQNNSDGNASTMPAYKLEKWEDGKWAAVNNDQMFTEQMIELKAGENYEQKIELKGVEPGTYRIIKTFYKNDYKHEVAVVFQRK